MGKSKTNISQINQYVKGRLNARDMHQLERETYDDAFLDEALEGYEVLTDDDHEETYALLKSQLHERAATSKQSKVLMWRSLSIAASIVVLLGAGYWFLKPDAIEKQNIATNAKNSKEQINIDKHAYPKATLKESKLLAGADIEPKQVKNPKTILREDVLEGIPSVTYKTDTVEYIASDYKVRANANVEELLKKVPGGFEIDTAGSITFNGQPVTKARVNGKDYSGGDVSQAVKSLPADIIDKLQVVDDYGDQAGRTGIKSGDANKVLNLTTRRAISTDSKVSQNALHIDTPQVIYKEDTVEFIVKTMRLQKNAKVENVIKRIAGFEFNDGDLAFIGRLVKSVRLNGKTYMRGNVSKAINKLTVNGLEKIQIIEDYSNVGMSFKVKEPEQVLNIIINNKKRR